MKEMITKLPKTNAIIISVFSKKKNQKKQTLHAMLESRPYKITTSKQFDIDIIKTLLCNTIKHYQFA